MAIRLRVHEEKAIRLKTNEENKISLAVNAEFVGNAPAYTGAYEFTPSQESQTIQISGYKATNNITINPIPSNYGLITWNGSTLTVS